MSVTSKNQWSHDKNKNETVNDPATRIELRCGTQLKFI